MEDARDPKISWWRRLLTVPALIATTALTAAVSWLVTESLSSVERRRDNGTPLAISVESNPGRISAFNDQRNYVVVPSEGAAAMAPSGCADLVDWARLNNGIDGDSTKLQLVVQHRLAVPVLISAMKVKILERLPPVTGTAYECTPAAEAQFRAISVDLDTDPPRVRYDSTGGHKPFGFTVSDGEIETFNVIATTEQCYCKWVIELDVVVEGKKQTLQVMDKGRPFQTVPVAMSAVVSAES